ncbi:MAG: hypothetical protein HY328_19500 [Chloroflexi bacterium]|nr:hypothetical protein [Chloroflexota bacterium]
MRLSFSASPIIGMIHIGPLPGTPYYGAKGDYAAVRAKAIADALALAEGRAQGGLVQNRDDRVFPTYQADPVVVAAFADITRAVVDAVGDRLAVGVQVLRNDLRASLAIAHICGGSFVRCGALIGGTETPNGRMEGDPYAILNYRRQIGAEKVQLIAEIASMHFHSERPLSDLAHDAAFVGVDAVGIAHPDLTTSLDWVAQVKTAAPQLPVIIGGYTNAENIARYLAVADGAFVGGAFEDGGRGGAVNVERVKKFMQAVKK